MVTAVRGSAEEDPYFDPFLFFAARVTHIDETEWNFEHGEVTARAAVLSSRIKREKFYLRATTHVLHILHGEYLSIGTFPRSKLRLLSDVFSSFSFYSDAVRNSCATKITRSAVAVFSSRTSSNVIHVNALHHLETMNSVLPRAGVVIVYDAHMPGKIQSREFDSRARENAFHFVSQFPPPFSPVPYPSNSRSHRGEAPRPRFQLSWKKLPIRRTLLARVRMIVSIESRITQQYRMLDKYTAERIVCKSDSYIHDDIVRPARSYEQSKSRTHGAKITDEIKKN